MTPTEINAIVNQKLHGKLSKIRMIHMPDPQYYNPTVEEVKKILEDTKIDRLTYRKNKFDCDNFALGLKWKVSKLALGQDHREVEYCVGIVWGKIKMDGEWFGHAINWFIDDQKKLWFIEPQTDEIFDPEGRIKEVWMMYV